MVVGESLVGKGKDECTPLGKIRGRGERDNRYGVSFSAIATRVPSQAGQRCGEVLFFARGDFSSNRWSIAG